MFFICFLGAISIIVVITFFSYICLKILDENIFKNYEKKEESEKK